MPHHWTAILRLFFSTKTISIFFSPHFRFICVVCVFVCPKKRKFMKNFLTILWCSIKKKKKKTFVYNCSCVLIFFQNVVSRLCLSFFYFFYTNKNCCFTILKSIYGYTFSTHFGYMHMADGTVEICWSPEQ